MRSDDDICRRQRPGRHPRPCRALSIQLQYLVDIGRDSVTHEHLSDIVRPAPEVQVCRPPDPRARFRVKPVVRSWAIIKTYPRRMHRCTGGSLVTLADVHDESDAGHIRSVRSTSAPGRHHDHRRGSHPRPFRCQRDMKRSSTRASDGFSLTIAAGPNSCVEPARTRSTILGAHAERYIVETARSRGTRRALWWTFSGRHGDRPLERLAESIHAQGVVVDADELRQLPHAVELSHRLCANLAAIAGSEDR